MEINQELIDKTNEILSDYNRDLVSWGYAKEELNYLGWKIE